MIPNCFKGSPRSHWNWHCNKPFKGQNTDLTVIATENLLPTADLVTTVWLPIRETWQDGAHVRHFISFPLQMVILSYLDYFCMHKELAHCKQNAESAITYYQTYPFPSTLDLLSVMAEVFKHLLSNLLCIKKLKCKSWKIQLVTARP